MAEIKIFKDVPISDPKKDELDFGSYAEALVDVILGVPLDDLPFSIGVYGEWGSGKSTLMGFTQSKLSEQKIKTV